MAAQIHKQVRTLIVVLLAALTLQPLPTETALVASSHGTHFSAATQNLAVLNERRETVVRIVAVPQPKGLTVALLNVRTSQNEDRISVPAPRPDSTGPPPIRRLTFDHPTRGPPIS